MRFPLFATLLSVSLLLGCAHSAAPKQTVEAHGPALYPYNKPLTSLGAKFGELPPVAQNTVRAQAGSAEIVDVLKQSSGEQIYYKVLFLAADFYPPLYVAPDGSVLNPDLSVAVPAPKESVGSAATLITLSDLAPNIREAILKREPQAEVATINREIWGTHLVYVVAFKDEVHHAKLYIVADGTPLYQAPK